MSGKKGGRKDKIRQRFRLNLAVTGIVFVLLVLTVEMVFGVGALLIRLNILQLGPVQPNTRPLLWWIALFSILIGSALSVLVSRIPLKPVNQVINAMNRMAAGASLATALNLHPVLNIRGGKLDAQCVVRGDKHTQKMLIKLMEHDPENRFRFIPPDEISLCTAGTFVNAEDAAAWNDRVQKAFPAYQVEYQELSCSIACHVGCDSLAIAMALRGR